MNISHFPQKKEGKKKKNQPTKEQSKGKYTILGTPHISSRATIIKVIPPNSINPTLNIIAIWMISQNLQIREWN